ncbi:MAG: hypothetical protein OEW39_00790 [Deltaproteobacteria bacterium]|nr:hypothetical protein [Deltaproteobacteria bacterium]
MKALIFSAMASALIVLTGCGDSATKKTATPFLIMGTSGTSVDLAGTWRQPCMYSTNNSKSEISTTSVDGGNLTFSVSETLGDQTLNNCTVSPDWKMDATATIALGATGTATWVDGAGASVTPAGIPAGALASLVTGTITKMTLTPLTSAGLLVLNAGQTCGLSGYTLNTPMNLLGSACDQSGGKLSEYWAVVDSATPDEWYTGDDPTMPYQLGYYDPKLRQ